MTTILETVLTPTLEDGKLRYFDGEKVLLLAMAIGDFGRDYSVKLTSDTHAVKMGDAIRAAYSGDWIPGLEVGVRFKELMANYSQLPLKTVENFGGFEYQEPRISNEDLIFDPLGRFTDLPERVLGQFAGAHFSTAQKVYMKLRAKEGFLGDVGGRLNGLDLTYFESRWIPGRGGGPYDLGFFLHNFFDEENHLVSWKTGKDAEFVRDGVYTVIGGSVKGHDASRGIYPPKTLLTRAKFFDHQAS